MGRRLGSFLEGGLTEEICNRIQKGKERKTISEWADEYHKTYQQMSQIFCRIRARHHIVLRPLSKPILVNGVMKTGIVVDINDRKSWALDGTLTYSHNCVAPKLDNMFRDVGVTMEKYEEDNDYMLTQREVFNSYQKALLEAEDKLFIMRRKKLAASTANTSNEQEHNGN